MEPFLYLYHHMISLFRCQFLSDSDSFLYICLIIGHTDGEVMNMASYVSPAIREQFETLSVNLKNMILERNVTLENMNDLIQVLESIVKEGESE